MHLTGIYTGLIIFGTEDCSKCNAAFEEWNTEPLHTFYDQYRALSLTMFNLCTMGVRHLRLDELAPLCLDDSRFHVILPIAITFTTGTPFDLDRMRHLILLFMDTHREEIEDHESYLCSQPLRRRLR